MEPDIARRFGGVARLYGEAAAQAFRQAHVCVIGIGGVGSWVAEALARHAIGTLTLVDLDHVAESNTNRQIHALGNTYGQPKVQAMSERVLAIAPNCVVHQIEDFVEPDNLDCLLTGRYDYIVDAIDNVRAKTALIAWCRVHKIPLITCGGAGGRYDPSRIRVEDLSRTVQDPLLSKVRGNLRRHHGFPRDTKKKFAVEAVFSDEPIQYPKVSVCETAASEDPSMGRGVEKGMAPQGLSCAGFGSSVCVTATFGFVAVARVLQRLAAKLSC